MATHTYTDRRGRVSHRRLGSTRSAAQSLSTLLGLALIAFGVAGFIPSLTTNSTDLANSGPDSQALVFGLYQVSVLHNLLHIVSGVLALMAANGPRIAKTFLLLGGLGYLALTAYGFSIDLASDDNVLSLNQNGNWLHFGVGIAMMLMGVLTLRGRGHRDEKVVDDTDSTPSKREANDRSTDEEIAY